MGTGMLVTGQGKESIVLKSQLARGSRPSSSQEHRRFPPQEWQSDSEDTGRGLPTAPLSSWDLGQTS